MPSLYQCQIWRCCKTKVSLICSARPISEGKDHGKEGHQCRKVAQESLHEQYSRDSTLCPLHPPALHSPLPSTPSYLLATTPPPCHLPVALCSVSSATNKQFLPHILLQNWRALQDPTLTPLFQKHFICQRDAPPPHECFCHVLFTLKLIGLAALHYESLCFCYLLGLTFMVWE